MSELMSRRITLASPWPMCANANSHYLWFLKEHAFKRWNVDKLQVNPRICDRLKYVAWFVET
jgi:hypothetical protein